MKVLLLLLLTSACANMYRENPYAVNSVDKFVRQCHLPVFIACHPDLNDEYCDLVNKSTNYWNRSVGERLFFNLGRIDLSNEGVLHSVVLFGINPNLNKKSYAITRFHYDTHGCMQYTSVEFGEVVLKQSNEVLETVIRHELGHVLGLDHIDELFTFNRIMNPCIAASEKHPVEIGDEEREVIRTIYLR